MLRQQSCQCRLSAADVAGNSNMHNLLLLYKSLCHHRFCNLDEAGDIRSLYVIDVSVLFGTILDACFMDIGHDLAKM